ncbi:MAG: class I SAM-dependent methyltransferase [Halieaceae bacterium]|jgi:ubiquinone/menaquinone biosynthesis C-methylase UbiE|nr:class I SAM-dependent methyltransferase [Halieaceae bacterium]
MTLQTATLPRNDTTPGTTSTLEYCFDSPRQWTFIHKPRRVQFRGWAASFGDGPARVLVTAADGTQSEHAMTVERPDVVAHFAHQSREASLTCGFDFELDIPGQRGDDYVLTFEVINDSFSSGPIEFRARDFGSMRWQADATAREAETSRGNYKDTWNAVSDNENDAKISVAGYTDEAEFERTSQFTLQVLQHSVGVNPEDTILEIGCGVGRMARTLSPLCKRWIGADVSENMLDHARSRTTDLDNVDYQSLNGWDLSGIEDDSIDMVYCTVVFMHLDEWDRFNYICEAKRVLRPGGRLYVDNYNLLSAEGWDFFMKNMLDYHPLQRPANISKSSTPQELCHFLTMAGFEDVRHHADDDMWVYAWGRKPG